MSYAKLLHISTALIICACPHKAQGKLTIFAPVGAPQGFVNIASTDTQTNSLIAVAGNKDHQVTNNKTANNKNNAGKQPPVSLSEIAKNVKVLIEEYTKRRDLAQSQGSENRYDELLKDANDLAKEIEDASQKYDELRLEQSQKGNAESGEQANRLTEIIQSRTEPFNSLLWRMDQVIAEIKHDDTVMPDRAASEGIPPTSKLVALTARTQREEPLAPKSTLCEDEEGEEEIKHKSLQPFKAKGDDLDDLGE